MTVEIISVTLKLFLELGGSWELNPLSTAVGGGFFVMSTFSRYATSTALNLATGSQSLTGFGFTPKLNIFITEPSTSDIVADIANFHFSLGAAIDSSNKFVLAVNSRNGQTSSATSFAHDTSLVGDIADPPGTMNADYLFDFVSNDADGITINVTDAPPSNYKFGVLSIGGDAITNVALGRFNSKGSTGSQVITGVGFQADCYLLFSVMDFHDPRTSGDEAAFCMSLITPTNQIAYTMMCRDNQNPSVASRAMNASVAFLGTTNGTSIQMSATLTSIDADGLTLNWGTHSVAVGERIYFIALKGAADMNFNVGSITLPTSTGTFLSASTGFANRAGIFLGAALAALTSTLNTNMELSVGLSADTRRYMIGGQDKGGVSPTNATHFSHSQRIFRNVDQAGAVQEDVDMSSWQNSGFILDSKVAVGASPSVLGYLVMGTDTDADSVGGSDGTGGSGDPNSPDSSILMSVL